MRSLKSAATAGAVLVFAATAAFAQTATDKKTSDVPLQCRTLSEPDRSICIREAQSPSENTGQTPVRGRENKGVPSGTPVPSKDMAPSPKPKGDG